MRCFSDTLLPVIIIIVYSLQLLVAENANSRQILIGDTAKEAY